MLQPVFPMFSSGITASAFASANVPGEDRFCCILEVEDFSLVTLGKCIAGWYFFDSLLPDPVHPSHCFEIRVTLLPMFRGTGKSVTVTFYVTFSATFLIHPEGCFFFFFYMPVSSWISCLRLETQCGSKTTVPSGELKLLASYHLFCH